MSTSDLYLVNKRSTTWSATYRNGWGTAPAIWGVLGVRFLGWASQNDWGISSPDTMRLLWALVYDEQVPRYLRLVHAMTFDYAIVPADKQAMEEIGAACIQFGEEFAAASPNQVNHWPAIGDLLQAMSDKRRHPACQGYGLSGTSVNDLWGGWSGGPVYSVLDLVQPVAQSLD